MKNPKEQAEKLLFELSFLDEDLIFESAAPYSPKKKKATVLHRNIRVILISALISLLLCSLLVGVLRTVFRVTEPQEAPNPPEEQETEGDGGENAPLLVSREHLQKELFSKRPAVIVEKGAKYQISPISEKEYHQITACVHSPKGSVSDTEPKPDEKIWVCDGNGKVYSPHLRFQGGNIAYGDIFDYIPEVIPNEELQKILNSYL